MHAISVNSIKLGIKTVMNIKQLFSEKMQQDWKNKQMKNGITVFITVP